MIKRDYKTSGEGYCFHVFNRGNNFQNIFLDVEDYRFFLLRLEKNIFPNKETKRSRPLPDNSFSLLSYCLMPNHFHLLIRQNKEYTIQQLLLRVCTSYSMYFNKKYKRKGHVFQDRFKQVDIIDDKQLLWLHAYINLNPAIDKIVEDIAKYQWSSYCEISNMSKGLCDKSFIKEQFNSRVRFEKFMQDALPILQINKKLRKFGLE